MSRNESQSLPLLPYRGTSERRRRGPARECLCASVPSEGDVARGHRARSEHEQVLVALSGSVRVRVLEAVDPERSEDEEDRARSAVGGGEAG